MATGWPTIAQLAARVGLQPGDDTANLQLDYDAAQATAVKYGVPAGTVDATLGAATDDVFLAILDLGVGNYQSRNRPSDFATQGPFAVNTPSRYKAIAVIMGGTVAIG